MQAGWPDGYSVGHEYSGAASGLAGAEVRPARCEVEMATPVSNSVPLTGDPLIDGLTQGGSWTPNGTPTQLTYSLDLAPGGLSWSDSTADAVARALQEWSNVADLTFTKVGVTSGEQFNDSTADMAFSLSFGQMIRRFGLIGFAVFPDPSISDDFRNQLVNRVFRSSFDGSSYPHPEGDVFIEAKWSGFSDTQPGGAEFEVIMHEIGHALGLKHPHDNGLNGRPTFAHLGIASKDTGFWTIMSYHVTSPLLTAGNQATPMPLDILAIQHIYGANTAFHNTDDTYLLADDSIVRTIWDAGGIDTIDASGLSKGVTSLDLHEASFIQHGTHSVTAIAYNVVIENAIGTNFADKITGNDVGNQLTGNAGNDTVSGFGGNDTIDGGAGIDKMTGGDGNDIFAVDDSKDVVTETSAAGGYDKVMSGANFTLGANIEELDLAAGVGTALAATGNASDNLLQGNEFNDTLDGKAVADTMKGGLGDDTYIVDNVGDLVDETGGGGIDTVKSSAPSYTLGSGLENLTLMGSAITGIGNELANIIIGTTAGNTLSGLDGNDSLSGDKGNDTLTGGNDNGNDTLDGGAGSDSMSGGAGNDLYRIDVAGDQIDPGADAGTDTVESAITFILGAQQENLTLLGTAAINGTGNDSSNVITGNAGANILDGGTKGETDNLSGGAGNDTYLVDSTGDKVTELSMGGTDLVKSSQTYTLSDFVENLTLLPAAGNIDGTGNGSNNVITGNEGNNKLFGLEGNDTLNGGDGNDRLDGGNGNDAMTGGNGDDVYVVGSPSDKVTESSAAGGHDTVESSITYTLGTNLEDLKLTSSDPINGTGNTLDNLLVGGGGANKLDGKAGADTMQGGLGDDVYVVDNGGDKVDETGGGGSDTIQIATTFDLMAPSIAIIGVIENVTLTGAAAVNASGDGGANHLIGNSGANKLTGLGGDDTLDGLAGADTMNGGDGNDTYVVDSAKDVVQETGSGTADLIQASIAIDLGLIGYNGIEDAALTGTSGLSATGDEQDNHLTGNGGANLLSGKDGADTLIGGAGNDTLDGGAGVDIDSLAGGLGNDTYVIAAPDDIVSEALDEGIDTVRTALPTYTLAANVENLVLLAGALFGNGNGLNNVITGNDAFNTLFGGAGADTLVGGKGNDIYYVDDAKDVVTEVAGVGSGTDEIATTVSYTLGAYVENLTLMPGAGSISGTGNTLDNTINGNEGDNTLDGKTGKDEMSGAGGNDTYIVDNVGDFVNESGDISGIDTVKSSVTFSLVDNGKTAMGEIENLTLTGTAGISGTGNTLANHILGNAGANKLFGDAGNDTIEGGAGADTIDGGTGSNQITGGAGNDHIDVANGDDTVFYTSKLDGKDVIDHFDGNATGGQDHLDLDALFDGLGVATVDRAGRVSVIDNGTSVDVHVDADGKAGFELVVATLNTADDITIGPDILVGSL